MIYIFWTCRSQEEAKKIIYGLLDEKLIACASIIPSIQSIYRWEGKVEESTESKVILKTQPKHFPTIQNYILEHGSYDIPEIVQIEAAYVNPSYLNWVNQEIRPLSKEVY